AQTRQRAAGAGTVVERAAVVVAHLDQDEVAGLGLSQNAVPPAFGLKRPAAAAADRVVLDLDPRRVEKPGDRVAPTLLAAGAGLHGGIADDEERRHGRLVEFEPKIVVHDPAHRAAARDG